MRTLLILVCTFNLCLTGCKTAKKQSSCGSCGVQCAATRIGAATITDQAKPEIAATPKSKTIIETSHVAKPALEDIVNPFKVLAAAEKAKAETRPAVLAAPKNSHAHDYRWLVGHLQRVHAPRHEWKLRYAALDENDQWGGSVILAEDVQLDEWNDGDQVYVEGEILTERPSVYLSGPLYRINIIRPASEVTQIVPRAGN